MTTPLARLGAALVLALTASLATACTSTPPTGPDTSASGAATPSTPAPDPSTEPSGAPTAGADPTCDTLISAQTIADFHSIGWTARTDPFYIGDSELPDGLQCVWADFEGPAGDHLQMFGWAPITAAAATDAQDALVGQGWIRETSVDGTYITESPESATAVDDEGYGMTYLFGDGWVKVADTKQGLLLIEWAPSS
ncbi:hypothetical protein [Microbacterium deminutum]|uniref:Nitrate ABC transporter substrate-binding protein n=1 Tax=Microbacterium deminutum TaxID=344164 RepID=A0ABN2QWW8_9MICO